MYKRKGLTIAVIVMVMMGISLAFQSPALAVAPANDEYQNATEILLPFNETIDTTEATENPSDAWSCGYSPAKTVWYKYTPATSGVIQISTIGSSYNTVITVYTDNFGNLVENFCSLSTLQPSLTTGVTYYIRISAYSWMYPPMPPAPPAPGGTLVLSVTKPAGPPNDNFADAKVILLDENQGYDDSVNNNFATKETEEPSFCWGSIYRTVWYQFTPTKDGKVTGSFGGYSPGIAVYTGSALNNLEQVRCMWWNTSIDFNVKAGVTYFIQLFEKYEWGSGWFSIHLNFLPSPPNDNWENALVIPDLPISLAIDNSVASIESNEPLPTKCYSYDGYYQTLWFAYTPDKPLTVTFENKDHNYWPVFTAVYTGDALANLTELACRTDNYLSFKADAGTTYFIQIGSIVYWQYGSLTLDVYPTPPPTASFGYWPGDASIFDNIQFYNYSYDPYNIGISSVNWNFGDGTSSTEWSPGHLYLNDGDYTVSLQVQTPDGRTASTQQIVSVRTHDVAITKFQVPQSAASNQSRTILVGVRNNRYPEKVRVELYKSTPYGWEWVGSLQQSVPIRAGNRTTDFTFKYTFTKADAALKKITFKAIAMIVDYRDALPLDNEMISLPTTITK